MTTAQKYFVPAFCTTDSVCKLVVAGTCTNISPYIGRIDGVVTC